MLGTYIKLLQRNKKRDQNMRIEQEEKREKKTINLIKLSISKSLIEFHSLR
jgi:hypothetical protein